MIAKKTDDDVGETVVTHYHDFITLVLLFPVLARYFERVTSHPSSGNSFWFPVLTLARGGIFQNHSWRGVPLLAMGVGFVASGGRRRQ